MQYAYDARLCTQPLSIGTEHAYGMMGRIKEQIKECGPVAHYQTAQLLGQREYQVIISSGQQFTHPVLQPLFFFNTTTIRTMPVATAMVLVMLIITTGFVAQSSFVHRHLIVWPKFHSFSFLFIFNE
jgi:hypothetical protein